jgi:VanZ family protein
MTAHRSVVGRGPMVLALTALAVIALTTLRPSPAQVQQVAETSWRCLVCGDAGVTDVLLNLLLFFPLGAALSGLQWPTARAVGSMLALTLAIEATQATLLAGRDPSLSDVLANTAGGLGGYLAAARLGLLLSPTRPTSRLAAGSWLAIAITIWLATGAALRPEASEATPWVGQWLREWPGHDRFPGQLLTATVNGRDVPNDPLPEPPRFDGEVTLTLRLIRHGNAAPSRPASLLRVVDGRGRLQLAVTQRAEDVQTTIHAHASAWRVRTPTWRFADAMAIPADVPWRMEWRWHPDRVELQSGPDDGSPMRQRSIRLSVGLGWVFVHPFAAAIDASRINGWTVLWLALWGVPLGWWLGWLRQREAALWAAVVIGSYCAASVAGRLPIRGWEVLVLLAWVMAGATGGKWRAARIEKRGSAKGVPR